MMQAISISIADRPQLIPLPSIDMFDGSNSPYLLDDTAFE